MTFSGRNAHGFYQLDAGDGRSARAIADELEILDVALGDMERIDQRRRGDDGGSVLVVVEDRNIHDLAQALLDHETFGGLDVLEIYAAKGGAEVAHGADKFIDILGVNLEIDGIDIGEALEEHGLAFHDRFRGERAQIAKAQNGGAIGDDGDEIALGRIIIGGIGIFSDGADRHGDARAIGQRQIALGGHGLCRIDFELSGLSHAMEFKGFFIGNGRLPAGFFIAAH